MEMIRRSGQRGVPVITVDDQVIVGFDRPRLDQALANGARSAAPAGGTRRRQLGAAIADAANIAHRRGQVPTFGAYIGRVTPNSPASLAGLQVGDIATEINMRRIANADDLEQALRNAGPDSALEVSYIRDGQTRHTTVQL